MSDLEMADTAPATGTLPGPAPDASGRGPRRPAWWNRPGVRTDALVCGIYVLVSVYVLSRLWIHPNSHLLTANTNDQTQFEYFLEYATRIVLHGEFPFFTTRMNMPDGVNLAVNTPTLGLSLPLVPVTLLFGHAVSFAVMDTLALVASAYAWYWLFSRHLVSSRVAAFAGGAFAGFAPGMISQSNGHPNLTFQALVPLFIWFALKLSRPAHSYRNGLVLGLLVIWQAFINEEVLLFTALAVVLFLAVWALHRPGDVRGAVKPYLRGLAVAIPVALVALSVPLYWQFAGPQVYHGLWKGFDIYGTDVAAIPAFSSNTPLGNWADANIVSSGQTEQNTFYGWPLVIFIVVLGVVFWRNLVARCAMIVAAVLVILSFGEKLRFNGVTRGPGPFAPLANLPIFDSVIASRLALFAIPVVGLLIALWVDRGMSPPADPATDVRPGRWLTLGTVVLALIAIAPTPLPTTPRVPTPAFVTSGAWRNYVPDGRTVMTVPITSNEGAMAGMQWAADTRIDMRIVGGYFLAPDPSDPTGHSTFGLKPRPTSVLLAQVAKTGGAPLVTDAMRADALNDLRYWRVAIMVLDPRTQVNAAALIAVTNQLVGVQPTFTGDVWVWDVRALVDGTASPLR